MFLVISKSLSPKLVLLPKRLFYQLGPAKSSGNFSVCFPSLHSVTTERVSSRSFPQNVFITEEFAQIFCAVLEPDEWSFLRKVNLIAWTDWAGQVSQARWADSWWTCFSYCFGSARSPKHNDSQKKRKQTQLCGYPFSLWTVWRPAKNTILSALIIKAGSEQKNRSFLSSITAYFLPEAIILGAITTGCYGSDRKHKNTKRRLWFQVRKQQWAHRQAPKI